MSRGGARPGAGKPPFEPTPEQRKMVEALVGYGIPYLEICQLIINEQTGNPINTETLMKHFRTELDTGATKANSKVIESLYRNAVVNDNVTAQIWWTKSRLGWKETKEVFLKGLNVGEMSEDELSSILERIRALEEGDSEGAGSGGARAQAGEATAQPTRRFN